LSDNVLNLSPPTSESQLNDSYAAFRLSSDDINLVGLARQSNESYTRDQFDFIQRRCAARGVTIIPEIEAPAHALPIVRWQPQLGLADDLTKLNISHPETIPVMKLIWSTFLPWIYSKVVHVGADEYSNSSMLERYV
jgi:hexosaminidase